MPAVSDAGRVQLHICESRLFLPGCSALWEPRPICEKRLAAILDACERDDLLDTFAVRSDRLFTFESVPVRQPGSWTAHGRSLISMLLALSIFVIRASAAEHLLLVG